MLKAQSLEGPFVSNVPERPNSGPNVVSRTVHDKKYVEQSRPLVAKERIALIAEFDIFGELCQPELKLFLGWIFIHLL